MVPGTKVGQKVTIYSVKKGSAKCRAPFDLKISQWYYNVESYQWVFKSLIYSDAKLVSLSGARVSSGEVTL